MNSTPPDRQAKSTYRPDIDGLRAFAVLAVFLFHCDISIAAGGYIGVDVFFVISGYLITGIIAHEITNNSFTLKGFYYRRLLRLAPALIVTLVLTLMVGAIVLEVLEFDRLGKEAAASMVGLANLLFAREQDYFLETTDAARPLLHLWSLGIEEQFYFVWPALLTLLLTRKPGATVFVVILSIVVSVVWSEHLLKLAPTEAYFLPHTRAFELMIGAGIALYGSAVMRIATDRRFFAELGSILAAISLFAMVFVFNEKTPFPGYVALAPCVATAVLILFAPGTVVGRVLGMRWIVLTGLISYPLYLLHQPMIVFTEIFVESISPWLLFGLLFPLAWIGAWLIYIGLEKPVQRLRFAPKESRRPRVAVCSLLAAALAVLVSGFVIGKADGFPGKFRAFNAFAADIEADTQSVFHSRLPQGTIINGARDTARVLVFGDSIAQDYIYPLSRALDVPVENFDIITRGGCVMVKDVDFHDLDASGLSCEQLRNDVYGLTDRYDLVVFTQYWQAYQGRIRNAPDVSDIQRWRPFIKSTLAHFKPLTNKILILASHPTVQSEKTLHKNMLLTESAYQQHLVTLKQVPPRGVRKEDHFFAQFDDETTDVVHMTDVFCCELHRDDRSYFRDALHLSRTGVDYATTKLTSRLASYREWLTGPGSLKEAN